MKIVVLGWGLLTWDTELNKEREFNVVGEWKTDGPELPIEFLRHTLDGKIISVINPGSSPVRTLWIESGLEYINQAVSNLRKREGTIEQNIGYLDINLNLKRTRFSSIIEVIKNWAISKGIEGVVWVDLSSNIDEKDRTVEGLKKLIQNASSKEKESIKSYLMNTHDQIQTDYREDLQNFVQNDFYVQ